MKTIVTITVNPSIDKSTYVQEVIPEHKLRCDSPKYDVGGGGVNVTRVINRLGGKSKAIFSYSEKNGELFRQLFHDEHMDYIPINICEPIRENLTVYERKTGNQFRFNVPGPQLSEIEYENFLNVFSKGNLEPEYTVISGSLPLNAPKDFYKNLIRKAKAVGSKIVFDASGEYLKSGIEEGVYLIKPNEKELATLAGCNNCTDDEMIQAAQKIILTKKVEVVVVSLADKGAILVTDKIVKKYLAPHVEIQSKVGAGDSMVAGIVYSLSNDNSIEDSVMLGLACGTAAVMTPGTDLCMMSDVSHLLEIIKKENI